ncbi:MAG TPA: hypothetical protein V6C76_02645 [Drouetiella sp.]
MGDRIEHQAEKSCPEPSTWEKISQALHLSDRSCNQAVDQMRQPNANAQKEVPNLMIEGVEAVQRHGRTSTINKQEAEMLKEI